MKKFIFIQTVFVLILAAMLGVYLYKESQKKPASIIQSIAAFATSSRQSFKLDTSDFSTTTSN